MASSMISTATMATLNRATPQVTPFTGLKSTSAFPLTRKTNGFSSLPTNGSRVQCMQVWPTEGLKKYETLSYLPTLTTEQLTKEVGYLIRSGWIPCLEFQKDPEHEGCVYRKYHASPGYYDGRYWTMWKLPMYGCTDPVQVVNELEEAKKGVPDAYIRIIGFDNRRQVQCISFLAYKPPRN